MRHLFSTELMVNNTFTSFAFMSSTYTRVVDFEHHISQKAHFNLYVNQLIRE